MEKLKVANVMASIEKKIMSSPYLSILRTKTRHFESFLLVGADSSWLRLSSLSWVNFSARNACESILVRDQPWF